MNPTRLMQGFAAFALGALISGHAAASETDEHIRAVEEGIVRPVLVRGETPAKVSFAERMKQSNVPGMSIAVIHKGRIEWARGYGVTQEGGPAVTADSLFQAASISKPVFALGVLHLVDAGKLDLDANVNTYLKTWKVPDNEFTKDRKVTLKGILSHSAGLTVHGFPGYAVGEKLPSTVQILDGTAPANTPEVRVFILPGEKHVYSGGGYVVAQQVLTDVTGMPLPKLLQDSVLGPFGMKRSTFEQPLPAKRLAEVALPHLGSGKPVEGGPHTYPEIAPAGLWTTPSDLARYALGVSAALDGKSKVISAQTARAMLTPVIGNQGIGPVVEGRTARKFFAHGGANAGYRCQLYAYMDGEGAIVMTNSDNGGPVILDVMRTIAYVYKWPDIAPVERTLSTVKPELLDRYVGAYQPAGGEPPFVVRREGDLLVGQSIGGPPTLLFPQADNEFFSKGSDFVVRFRAGESASSAVTLSARGRDNEATRLDAARTAELTAGIEKVARRFKEQKPDARSEAAARALIAGLASGKPDYERMSSGLAELTRSQLSMLQKFVQDQGELKSVTFKGVTFEGSDRYELLFAQGVLTLNLQLTEDGRIDRAGLGPG